jgi:hypothetical protein
MAGIAVLALTGAACSYHNAKLNFRDLEQDGIYIATSPNLSPGARPYGQVEITQRSFYFWPCTMTAEHAVRELRQASIERGGNLVRNVEFRSRRKWSTNPQCRRNLNYAWLLLPMLLPVPQSVNVRGESVYDPSFVAQPSSPP